MLHAQGSITIRRRPKDGNPGADAVRYWLVPSVSQVKKTDDGKYHPTSVTCEKRKQTGNSSPIVTSEGTLKYQIGYTDNSTSNLTNYSSAITIPANCQWIKFVLYVNNIDVATETVPVVFDGKEGNPGPQGLQGCIFRRSKFATGFEYHNDSALTDTGLRYIDLVYLMTDNTIYASHAKWFRCKKTHSSTESNAPQLTNNGTESWLEFWEPLNTMVPIYTPLLLADDAIITLMQSNQILIENDEGVITAGMSGSLAGKKIRIWAGSTTPDNAPFRVDVDGNLVATKADISGTINATSGKIAGFNISGSALTNGPDFSNDACIIFRNDTHKTFAGIGGNVLPATTGNRAVARFENEDSNNFWGLGRNIAMLLSAKNADINHAFLGTGNGNLDGWISGYHYSKYTINSSNTIYDGFLKISKNNKWIVYATGSSSGITLPTLSQVRKALGIGTSTPFCIEFIVVADLNSQNGFNIYGRCKKEVTVNGAKQTPYFTDEYPTMTHWNNGRYDNLKMGAGDAVTFLLVYDPNKTGVLDTSYTLMYTARIINRQN
ncbi:hypothetical protein NF347_08600 [Paramuribaculum intestinale]|uniref:hypothetical protein n=2 Tax=Paramuribaculum intestinale TaxID=2094151 RepID=UPI0027414B48|nr:hypothetical protein [Paramuribaculum intestinale]WLT41045.1 hypothetical protein NF347_08600 [Paramuribaculum intestinale]